MRARMPEPQDFFSAFCLLPLPSALCLLPSAFMHRLSLRDDPHRTGNALLCKVRTAANAAVAWADSCPYLVCSSLLFECLSR